MNIEESKKIEDCKTIKDLKEYISESEIDFLNLIQILITRIEALESEISEEEIQYH